MKGTPISNLVLSLLVIPTLPMVTEAAEISAMHNFAQVTVRIWDLAQVEGNTLNRAKAVVESAFKPMGIQLSWCHCGTEDIACSAPVGPNGVSLRIFQRGKTELQRLRHSTMGMAVPPTLEGRNGIAYVFFDRVIEVTRNQRVAPELALGVAIAHEMGHLLLPGHPHALVGIMRGDLKPKDWRLAAQGQLSFTDQQRDIIADGLRARNLQRT